MLGKPRTAVTTFDRLSLRSSMVYHLTYHHSLALHINHLVFLNTYLFGVWLLLSAVHPVCCWVAISGYTLYSLRVAGWALGLPFGLLQGASGYGAIAVHAGALVAWRWTTYEVAGLGFSLVIGSFLAQLAGHAASEAFVAPPHLFHGLVAAPLLEWVSLGFRLGALPVLRQEVGTEVAAARSAATALLSPP